MVIDKAIIIIAVSKYAGAYVDLPGVLTSASRLREWAEQPDDDRNYNVLYLADDVFDKITVELVREKVTEFVQNNFIDRLVVYFAGHGIVRSAGDQFWLLSNAANDLREGINVEAFRRGLLKYNIGKNTDDFPGQLCIIGDACRNIGRDAIDFSGDSILTSAARMNKRVQLDRFLSTGLGDYSFQINESGGQSAYCLFSEVLLDALSGNAEQAIQTEHHEFKPAVTNHKLALYLEDEVRTRAAAITEEMEPDLLTGIHPPYNYYKRLEEPFPIVRDPLRAQPIEGSRMAIPEFSRETSIEWNRADELLRENLSKGRSNIERAFEQNEYSYDYYYSLDFYRHEFLTSCDFVPQSVAAPRNAEIEVRSIDTHHHVVATDCDGAPILIQQDNRWILMPCYPKVVATTFHELPGDSIFYNLVSRTWDTYLSDFSALVSSAPLRANDAQKFADKIRIGKESFPHQSVTAAYLYEFSNDYDNVARTAHYMYQNTEIVPFDLALLCADRITWRKENDKMTAFADLPAVERSKVVEYEENRPYYTRTEFQARQNVRLWGIVPIFSQGWSFMQTETYLEVPESIRKIGREINGRSAVSLTNDGLEMFLEAFDYEVTTIDRLIHQRVF